MVRHGTTRHDTIRHTQTYTYVDKHTHVNGKKAYWSERVKMGPNAILFWSKQAKRVKLTYWHFASTGRPRLLVVHSVYRPRTAIPLCAGQPSYRTLATTCNPRPHATYSVTMKMDGLRWVFVLSWHACLSKELPYHTIPLRRIRNRKYFKMLCPMLFFCVRTLLATLNSTLHVLIECLACFVQIAIGSIPGV